VNQRMPPEATTTNITRPPRTRPAVHARRKSLFRVHVGRRREASWPAGLLSLGLNSPKSAVQNGRVTRNAGSPALADGVGFTGPGKPIMHLQGGLRRVGRYVFHVVSSEDGSDISSTRKRGTVQAGRRLGRDMEPGDGANRGDPPRIWGKDRDRGAWVRRSMRMGRRGLAMSLSPRCQGRAVFAGGHVFLENRERSQGGRCRRWHGHIQGRVLGSSTCSAALR
jgi:hypothetical protein